MIVVKILRCSLQMGFYLGGLLTVGCSLSPKENTSEIKVVIPAISGAKNQNQIPGFPSIRTANGTFYPPPTAISGFDCLLVNVMGPGIPAQGNQNQNVPTQSLLPPLYSGTSVCSYPGIISNTVPVLGTEQTINLEIPFGPGRIVQLLGGMSSGTADYSTCPQNLFLPNGAENPTDMEPYLIAQTTVDLFSDKAITLHNQYNNDPNMTNFMRKHIPCNPPIQLGFGSATTCNASTLTTGSWNLTMSNVAAAPATGYRIDIDNVTATGNDGTPLTVLGWSGTFFDYYTDTTVLTIASGAGSNLLPIRFDIQYSYPPLQAGGGSGPAITFNKTYYNSCL